MIFSAFSKPKCVVCKRKFHTVEEVKSNDRDGLEDALSLGMFSCSKCKIKFHGMCGKIGQANPKSAVVTCPNCHQRIKHPLPFKVQIIEKTGGPGQFGDRVDNDTSDQNF